MSTSTSWCRSEPFSRTTMCKGTGLIVNGEVIETRVHSVFINAATAKGSIQDQEMNLPQRFVVYVVRVNDAQERLYRDGWEVEYATNTTKRKDFVPPKPLTIEQLTSKVGFGGVALPREWLDERISKVHPNAKNVFEFYIDATHPKAKDVNTGHVVDFFTFGESIFVDKLKILNGKVNLGKAGQGQEELSTQWTGAIQAKDEPLAHEQNEGCDSEEWS